MRRDATGTTTTVSHTATTATTGPGRVHGGATRLQRGATGAAAMGERCLPGDAGK